MTIHVFADSFSDEPSDKELSCWIHLLRENMAQCIIIVKWRQTSIFFSRNTIGIVFIESQKSCFYYE